MNTIEENKTCEKVKKSSKKRKRGTMNDEQISMIEEALIDEPNMRLNLPSLQTWVQKLNQVVSIKVNMSLKYMQKYLLNY